MKKKLLITIEGIDGVGKETQTNLLKTKLENEFRIKLVSFPNYKSKASEPLKMYLNGEFGKNPLAVNPYAISTLFAIDRFASYIKDWGKNYEDGEIILVDRYVTSNYIYQGVKIEDPEERNKYIGWLNDLEFNKYGLPKPDIVIFLDLKPNISKKLREDRLNKYTNKEEKDIHEKNQEYMDKCYKIALNIAKNQNWEIIKCDDGEKIKPIEIINEEIYKKVIEKIKR